jgi:hypothetical protein
MYQFKFRYSQYIHRTQVVISFIIISVCAVCKVQAQNDNYNLMDHDQRLYYFGIAAGFNNSTYKIFPSDFFTSADSVMSITPNGSLGFQVGITSNLRLTNHTSLRLVPQFVLTQKSLSYDFKYNRDTTLTIESIMMHLPLQVKFQSDRIKNFRFYTFAGVKYDYDFNSNTRSRRNDEVLKIRSNDFGYDIGFGFDFYYPNFIFTPEVKISNGFSNVQFKDNKILTSKVFDAINTRMVFIGVIIGGG